MAKGQRRFARADCQRQVLAIEADVRMLVDGLTESQFHAPAKDGGWSIGLCLEHLILVAEAQLPGWRAALHAPTQAGKQCPNHAGTYSWFERVLLYSIEPPYRWRRKAPAWGSPSARRSIEDTLRRCTALNAELERLIPLADSWPGLISSLYHGRRHNLGFLIDSLLAHERRHIWHARRIRASFTESEKRTATLAC